MNNIKKAQTIAKTIQTELLDLLSLLSAPIGEATTKQPSAVPALKALVQAKHEVSALKTIGGKRGKKNTGIGLPNGTKLYTTITMGTRASGEQRVVRAEVRNGLVYVDGRSRGFDNLTRARRAAENVAGRAHASMKACSGTQSWRVERTGQTVEQFRKAPGTPRLVQAELKI